MHTVDLYKSVLWPHLKMRLPNGVRSLIGVKSEKQAHLIASNILDDYMEMAYEEMVSTGNIWVMPCLNTGYAYIKDQRDFIDDYEYDIDLDGALYYPVMILDRSISSKCKGYYKILINKDKIKKIQNNAKSGVKYNGD